MGGGGQRCCCCVSLYCCALLAPRSALAPYWLAQPVCRPPRATHALSLYASLCLSSPAQSDISIKLPDIKQTLQAVTFLIQKKAEGAVAATNFCLGDSLYIKANIPPTGKVCLWLGANVMLEYTVEEAKEMLEKNLREAEDREAQINSDLMYLKDQITTTEVNIARTYNYDVVRRREEKKRKLLEGASGDGDAEEGAAAPPAAP